jgi:hypothetical protein
MKIFRFSTKSYTPVTLRQRSHGDLDRHQIAVQNDSIDTKRRGIT